MEWVFFFSSGQLGPGKKKKFPLKARFCLGEQHALGILQNGVFFSHPAWKHRGVEGGFPGASTFEVVGRFPKTGAPAIFHLQACPDWVSRTTV